MNVLVTDGENRSALAVTRSLGRKGCQVFVAGEEADNISSSSRFCRKSFITPNPLTDGGRFADEILDIVGREQVKAVFPMTEQSIFQLNKIRKQLPDGVVLVCAMLETMEAVSNKFRLFHLAQSAGVPVPETIFVDGLEDFAGKEAQVRKFPAVVKPGLSRIPDGDTMIKTGVMYASDRDELRSFYESKRALRYPSLIQELIEGEGTGLFTLFDFDHHLALFSHRRLLEKPPSGGVSVISESVPLDPDMVESARKLLSAVGWKGVAMVEFKRDIRDGRAKLMEINGRFWGTLQLAVSSGVDFPALCLDYYLGNKPDSILDEYQIGHKLKWYLGILDHFIIRLKKGDRELRVPNGTFTRTQVVRELLKRGDSKTSYDVYEAGDLKPFLTEFRGYVRDIFR